MDMEIRVATLAERRYSYSQSGQIEGQTGCIGHLRGDMGSNGTEFYSSWEDHRGDLKTQEFKDEFDEVVNALRFNEQYSGVFKNRQSLSDFCHAHPESSIAPERREFCFRVNTAKYAYLMRLNPNQGDYNLYIYCYLREYLDQHMEQAKKGIRFITPDYQERFRIPDGDMIRIIQPDGQYSDRVCRYIDEAHFELDGDGWNNLLHICQFAEQMERCLNTVIPLRSSLPEQCYGTLTDTGAVVILKRGETGYYKTDIPFTSREEAQALANEYNEKLGVTKAQAEAMKSGSMFGWACPAADPRNYDAQGQPIKPKHIDRGDSR